jgi:hypothetical protein
MNVSATCPVDVHRKDIRRHMSLRVLRPIYMLGPNFRILKFFAIANEENLQQ